jgi:hypothetical protein
MSDHETQIRELDKKITALSDALARLGKGTTMQVRIIRNPGYTTPAELLFTGAIVELIQVQVNTIDPVRWVRNSHIPLEALWKFRVDKIPFSPDELKHLYDCGECVGSLCMCKISKTIEEAKGLQQRKPKLHN